MIATALALLALLAPASASTAPTPITATESHAAEICFPQRLWSARQEDDPCYLIGRPQEDRSGFLTLGTIGADAATCVIPNVFEERGRFSIRCHRVRNE
jgi:hypothetical protein